MNTKLTVLAIVTAGIAAGAYVLTTRNTKPATTAPKPAPLPFLGLLTPSQPQSPAVSPVAVTGATQAQAAQAVMPTSQNTAVNVAPPGSTSQTSTSQAVLEAQAAQAAAAQAAAEAARKEAIRQGEIQNYRFTIAAVENDQLQTLAQIKALEQDYNARIQQVVNDNSRLNDFTNEAINEMQSGSSWVNRVNICKAQVEKNCGFDLFGACNGANKPVCERRDPDFAWGNPAAAVWNEARDANNPNGGQARLNRWNEQQRASLENQYRSNRSPLEADLARVETQYKGLVRDLQTRYGVDFQSTRPEVHV